MTHAEALREAFSEFLSQMGMKESDLTLGEKMIFSIAFAKGRQSVSRQNVVPLDAAARNQH